MMELIEEIWRWISTINNLLYVKKILTIPDLSETLLKSLIHKLIRNLANQHKDTYIKIDVKDYRDVIKTSAATQLGTFTNLESLSKAITASRKSKSEAYKKLTLVTFQPSIGLNLQEVS